MIIVNTKPHGVNSDFQSGDAWEFIGPSTIFGMRAFGLRADGVLTGISWCAPWWPGTNEAECYRDKPTMNGVNDRHPLNDECPCGFYSYFREQETNGWDNKNIRVVGVVEGFGRMIVGPKGMRTSKARIRALCYRSTLLRAGGRPPTAIVAAMERYGSIPSFTRPAEMLAAFPVSPKPIGPGFDATGAGAA